MNISKTIGSTVAIALSLGGCAVTEQEPASLNVQLISAEQAKTCKFIDSISSNNSNTLSKNPEQDARNKALNKTAERGGNALKIGTTNTQIAPSGLGSIFTLSGEAYKCDSFTSGVTPTTRQVQSQLPTNEGTRSIADARSTNDTSAVQTKALSREAVLKAQERLNALGFSVGKPDGSIGPKSRAAIVRFQNSKGLPATGELSPSTLAALGA